MYIYGYYSDNHKSCTSYGDLQLLGEEDIWLVFGKLE